MSSNPHQQGLASDALWHDLEYKLDRLGCIETTTPSKAEFVPYQDVLNQARQMLKTSKPSAGMAGKIAELEGFAILGELKCN